MRRIEPATPRGQPYAVCSAGVTAAVAAAAAASSRTAEDVAMLAIVKSRF